MHVSVECRRCGCDVYEVWMCVKPERKKKNKVIFGNENLIRKMKEE